MRKKPIIFFVSLSLLVPTVLSIWGPRPGYAAADSTSVTEETKAGEVEKPPIEVTFKHGLVSIHAVEADCHRLLVRLAEETGLSLIVDDTVNSKVTVNLTALPPEEAVNAIALYTGLVVEKVGKSLVVSAGIPEKASSYLRSEIVSVPTKYVLADTAKSLLPQFLFPYVKVNESQNAVVLSAPPQALEKFRSDVAEFDIPACQIMLEILMVELTKSAAKELASTIEWSEPRHAGTLDTGTGEITFQALADLTKEFSTTLKALTEKGEAKVHASPRIATVSGHAASIFVGIKQYLLSPISTGGDYYGGKNFIEAGVSLDMTPWTGGAAEGQESEIIVSLSPAITTLGAMDPTTKLPEKTTRQASTTVRVRAGQSIVIGGLMQHEVHEKRRGIPVLRELPLIGPAFESFSTTETDTELVVFVTPRVISGQTLPGETSAPPSTEQSGEGER